MAVPASKSRSGWRRWLRPAIVVPIVASLAVHAAMLVGLVQIQLEAPPRRLTDAPAETLLTLAPPTPNPTTPPPQPVPPTPPPADPPPEVPAAKVAIAPPPAAETPKFFTNTPPPPKPAPPPQPRPAQPKPPAPPPAPQAVFAGVASERASRIVYVLDASGMMTTSLPFVKAELARSVARLEPSQSFQVVVFRQPPGAAEPIAETFDAAGQMVAATDDAKTRLGAWIETIQPTGQSTPLAGLRAAIGLHPDLIFLLTRSIRRSGPDTTWGEGAAATLAELDRLNPRNSAGARPAVIKALQFIDPDPTGLLPAIANTHGDGPGSYRVITLDDLK